MMDKERLEEIKDKAIEEKVHYKHIGSNKGGWTKTYTLSKEDFNWLIQQVELGLVQQEQLRYMQEKTGKN